ncbi:hypothetical protein BD410DRAFT_790746 [Rickenella mellea]|uniref:Aminoglycoside phosphotransferase domain-containing protein n=1 Tax=Rickenella mellea TaxID=50990 RepID=A0A4Y7PYP4_9AGAM|nr:hypothetical protein BD410DRAFT_790746 [Rickenella mellea]
MSFSVTDEQAQAIVKAYCGAHIKKLEIVQLGDLHAEYVLHIVQDGDQQNTFTLLVVLSPTLSEHTKLIELVASNSPLSPPTILKSDLSLTILPTPYLLLTHTADPSIWAIRPKLSPHQSTIVDLRLGNLMRTLHRIENDWFGPCNDAATWKECVSWQICFSTLMEDILAKVETSSPPIVFPDGQGVGQIRSYLGRAIGLFLFDDVEVPTLVWYPGLNCDRNIFLSADLSNLPTADVSISELTGWGSAIWGDPLMEISLRAPSTAFLEGYGGTPFLFRRQHTKRLWYTLFAALCALMHVSIPAEVPSEKQGGATECKGEDILELVSECMNALRNAPCY